MIASWLRPPIPVQDPLSGFFLVRRASIAGVTLQPQGFMRRTDRSRASLKVGWEYLSLLWRLRRAGAQPATEPPPRRGGSKVPNRMRSGQNPPAVI